MLKQILSNPTVLAVINGRLRHVATIAGTALATVGVIDTSNVTTFAGAFVVILSMVLSGLSKKLAA